MLVTIAEKCKGSEHEKTGLLCQDDAKAEGTKDKNFAYAVVADGHGGEKYFRSNYGSQFATMIFKVALNEILQQKDFWNFIKEKNRDSAKKNILLLEQKITDLWRKKVIEHYNENPLSDTEKKICETQKISLPILNDDIPVIYGTTFLATAYFEKYDFWFAVQIGDGKCVVIKNDENDATKKIVESPVPEDEKLGFGVTTSLCSKNAGSEFRFEFGFEKIAGLAVMTDGMTDSFTPEKLFEFILKIQKNALDDLQKTKTDLKEFLPTLSEKGSGDDISVAAIFQKT